MIAIVSEASKRVGCGLCQLNWSSPSDKLWSCFSAEKGEYSETQGSFGIFTEGFVNATDCYGERTESYES